MISPPVIELPNPKKKRIILSVKCRGRKNALKRLTALDIGVNIMLKVEIGTKVPKAIIKDGKPAIEFDESTVITVVPSTKSLNNLIDDLNSRALNPQTPKVRAFKLDEGKASAEIAKVVESLIPTENAEIKTATANLIIDGMRKACMFK